MKNSLTLFTLLLGFVGCTNSTVDQKAEGEKLMELTRQWAHVAQTADKETMLTYWAKDAIVMMPGQPSFRGHEAIGEMLDGSAKIPGFEIKWEPT